jgi:hypothetical protein
MRNQVLRFSNVNRKESQVELLILTLETSATKILNVTQCFDHEPPEDDSIPTKQALKWLGLRIARQPA